jgi:hypothetical protein
MRTSRTISVLAAPLAVLSLLGAGCAGSVLGSGLSASSSCKDFMTASQEEQTEAISKLSSQFDTPEVATPLGTPSIAYTCTPNPDMSLEVLFHKEHEGEGTGL